MNYGERDPRRPSEVTDVPWIYACAPKRCYSSPPFFGLRWVGKWLLFVSSGNEDARWDAVANATVSGDLGIQAKVLTEQQPPNTNGSVVICVYTADCRNMDDVTRVLAMLRSMGYQGRLNYKEDLATHAGLYKGGSGPASLYTSPSGSEVRILRPVTNSSPGMESQDRFPG